MIDLADSYWRGVPGHVENNVVRITTSPGTDLWQRTYYGFQVVNAPALLVPCSEDFTFTVEVEFDYQRRYDQAGVLVWADDDNWFKASIEFENNELSRLGSVLTTAGYSDWATQDIGTASQAAFRLSRRGPDFRLEARVDATWEQLRVFHMAPLGETTPEPTDGPMRARTVDVGVYAASPEQSSFTALFKNLAWGPTMWEPHS